ncbi:MAG: RNA polymerase sigma factor [Bacteroidales bacterium]|nr:RNA polymerase sigma factor [Bacteroidales bacterium]
MKAQGEKELIQQVLQGDTSAFALLVDAHKDRVFNLVFRVIRQRAWAEELCQDVFIKVYQQLAQFKHKARFSTWLFRIAYNTAISALRKHQLSVHSINESHSYVEEDNQGEKEALISLLEKAIAQLSTEEAALITLCYTEEKTIEEIAQITGLSKANVKVKLHRVRVKLKMIIERSTNKN